MGHAGDEGVVIVTGAGGHIGREVCRLLTAAGSKFLPLDVPSDSTEDLVSCDLRKTSEVSRLFQSRSVQAVIHLAAILPSAFHRDPLTGADVNLTGSVELLRQAVKTGTKRFVFASSMSVYGSSIASRPLVESDPVAPDDPYGASKRAVELVGETLATGNGIQFVSLRIARVVGPGIKKTSSPWRSEIFEPSPSQTSISIPFAPESVLSLVHVEDVARMLIILAETPVMRSFVYNTPVELWETHRLKAVVEEARGIPVTLDDGGAGDAGPLCDGSRFAREFAFQLRGLRDRLFDHPSPRQERTLSF
jgi:nucleoside-diphosphate-sugar epimerase